MADNGELNPAESDKETDERHAGQRQSFKQRWRKLTVGNQITAASNVIIAVTTGLYVLVSILTWLAVSRSSEQTSKQVGELIRAANIQACAAQKIADASDRNANAAKSFSATADKIREETVHAVGELQRAANYSETAMKENSRNAKIALDASIAASHLDERPWVVAQRFLLSNEPEEGKMPTVTIWMINTGKTPALNLVPGSQPFISSSEPPPPLAEDPAAPVTSIGVLAPGPTDMHFTTGASPFHKIGIDLYKFGSARYYIRAKITYLDVNNVRHWTTICASHAYGRNLAEFEYCSEGNDMDKNK
jgi:hypothetical protein